MHKYTLKQKRAPQNDLDPSPTLPDPAATDAPQPDTTLSQPLDSSLAVPTDIPVDGTIPTDAPPVGTESPVPSLDGTIPPVPSETAVEGQPTPFPSTDPSSDVANPTPDPNADGLAISPAGTAETTAPDPSTTTVPPGTSDVPDPTAVPSDVPSLTDQQPVTPTPDGDPPSVTEFPDGATDSVPPPDSPPAQPGAITESSPPDPATQSPTITSTPPVNSPPPASSDENKPGSRDEQRRVYDGQGISSNVVDGISQFFSSSLSIPGGEEGRLPTGTLVGLCVATFAIILIVFLSLFCLVRKFRRRKAKNSDPNDSAVNDNNNRSGFFFDSSAEKEFFSSSESSRGSRFRRFKKMFHNVRRPEKGSSTDRDSISVLELTNLDSHRNSRVEMSGQEVDEVFNMEEGYSFHPEDLALPQNTSFAGDADSQLMYEDGSPKGGDALDKDVGRPKDLDWRLGGLTLGRNKSFKAPTSGGQTYQVW